MSALVNSTNLRLNITSTQPGTTVKPPNFTRRPMLWRPRIRRIWRMITNYMPCTIEPKLRKNT